MGNCCCKSGAAGAVAASESDGYGVFSPGTGRSQLGAGSTFGTSSKGKKGGAVRLLYMQYQESVLVWSDGPCFALTGG